MRVWILGTGDAFSEQRYNASFIVQSKHDNRFHDPSDGFFNLAVECPHPYRKILLDCEMKRGIANGPKLEDIDHFLISHLHGDHMNGLEDVIFYKRFVQGVYPHVYMSRWDLDQLWKHRLKCAMGTTYDGQWHLDVGEDFLYYKHSLSGPQCHIGPFVVETRVTQHHIPAIAMLIKEGDKSVAFSSDTVFDPSLIDWMNQADLIIHEATGGLGHTRYESLVTLSKKIKDKMVLIHYPDSFNRDTEIRKLREGEVLEV